MKKLLILTSAMALFVGTANADYIYNPAGNMKDAVVLDDAGNLVGEYWVRYTGGLQAAINAAADGKNFYNGLFDQIKGELFDSKESLCSAHPSDCDNGEPIVGLGGHSSTKYSAADGGQAVLNDVALANIQSSPNTVNPAFASNGYADSLQSQVGDTSKLAAAKDLGGAGTLTDAVLALDSVVHRDEDGKIHIGENSFVLDDATGDITYYSDGGNTTEAAINFTTTPTVNGVDVATADQVAAMTQSMNQNFADIGFQLQGLSTRVDDLSDELRASMAAANAMSALVPNARSAGNTQISVGTGGYRDQVGIAAGMFHYVSNGTLVNAGVSYGTGRQGNLGWRAGVTFGF
jgi:hypothetical protein